MELRHIKYFLALVKERNFTRAAEKLGIGQPPLSMQIKDLENEIGYPLFNRTSQGVEMTEAGEAFLLSIEPVQIMATEAIDAARRAAQGETGTLRLGFTGTTGLNSLIPSSIREFRRAYPAVYLKLTEANSVTLLDGLLNRQIDIALIRSETSVPKNIAIHHILDEPLIAALSVNHPLAKVRGHIRLEMLQDSAFILTPKIFGTSLRAATIKACLQAGFQPLEGQTAPHIVSILSVVAAGLGVSLVPESMKQFALANVTFRQIKTPAPVIGLAAAWHSVQRSMTAVNFLEVVKQNYYKPLKL